MPQLPTSTAEEYGADDEIKEYRQEDDDGAENSNLDVVNDIKTDLKKDAEDQTLDSGKGSIDEGHFSGIPSERHVKGEAGVYGRPAPVIVGPHRYPTNYPPGCNSVSHTTPHHPVSYSSGTQIHMPVYGREDRGAFYEHRGWHNPQVPIMGSPHGYPPYYAGGPIPSKTEQGHIIYDYRHAPHHGMVPPNSGVIAYPGSGPYSSQHLTKQQKEKSKLAHVKKPLNAFMLYMKEMRPKIAAECTLKESAAINQILGKRWHALDRSEQAKYYEMARKERAIHMQMYPGWTARDNYAQLGRKKKRRKDKNQELNPKKCRARYGLDRQDQWCKPCRRKKKCIRFVAGAEGNPEAEEENEAPRSDGSSVGDQDVGQISDLKEEIADSPPTMVENLSEEEPPAKVTRTSPIAVQSPAST